MSHIYVSLTISNMAGSRSKEVAALADTGATLTVIPERIARELEMTEVARERVETGAGETEMVRSAARITIDGKQSATC